MIRGLSMLSDQMSFQCLFSKEQFLAFHFRTYVLQKKKHTFILDGKCHDFIGVPSECCILLQKTNHRIRKRLI